MPREFLRKFLELIKIFESASLLKLHDKAMLAVEQLDDELEFEFQQYFDIRDVIVQHIDLDSITLRIDILKKHALVPFTF